MPKGVFSTREERARRAQSAQVGVGSEVARDEPRTTDEREQTTHGERVGRAYRYVGGRWSCSRNPAIRLRNSVSCFICSVMRSMA